MPRAIQDSEDDGEDFDSVSPVSEKASAASNHPMRDALSRSQKSAPGGTSSTEAIQREVEAARREVLGGSAAPTYAWNRVGSSPRMHRRNTTLETGYGSLPTKRPHRRSTMVTYGSSRRRGQSTFEDGTFESMKESEVVGLEAQFDSSPGDVEFVAARDTYQKPSEGYEGEHVVTGSLQPDFAGHEPRMFGTSDTVPDDTMDQQPLIDAAVAEYANGRDAAHEEAIELRAREGLGEDPSPPWSDYLHSPEMVTLNSTPQPNSILRRSNTFGHPRTSQLGYPVSENTGSQQVPSSASAKKRRASLAVVSSQPSDYSVKKHRPADDLDELAQHDDRYTTKSQKVDHSIQESIHAVRAARAAKSHKDTSSEPLNGDDVLIGLPKERYQPRPSRSRSNRLAVEERIDCSVNPEKAAKREVEQRKTEDASTIGRVKLSTAEKRERMIAMEFSPTASRRALKEYEDDADKTIEALSNADHGEATRVEKADYEIDEVADRRAGPQADEEETKEISPRARKAVVVIEKKPSLTAMEVRDSNLGQPKRKRGRPPKVRPSEGLENAKITHEATGPHDETKTDHHDTILEDNELRQSGVSLNRRPSPMVVPTLTGSAQPVMTAESNKLKERAAETLEAQEILPKKRGRGRPRKQESPKPSTPNRHEAMESDLQETRRAKTPQAANSEAPSWDKPKNQTPGHGSIREAPVSTPHDVTSSQSSSALQPSTANALETASRSPASKGKVSYRVGLSKRTRVAPLLKIMKK